MSIVVKVLTDVTDQEPPDTADGDARVYLKAIDLSFCFALRLPLQSLRSLYFASDALQN